MIAVALVGLLAPASAEAALYWSDQEPSMGRPARFAHPKRQRLRHRGDKQTPQKHEKESAKPQGPLVIAISIDRQTVRVYDANGLFAESPVSTGMRGHPTPMGMFSVIQKDKFHRSNIYSNAPMPYMQRVTWSGVAMHAGVLPGYPASHGCIRMPMAFAVKMWGWTRMGARVVITPGEVAPSEFAHPLLALRKAEPAPVPMASATPAPDSLKTAQPTAKSDKSAAGDAKDQKREQTRTADASGAIQVAAPATLSDAAPTPSAEAAPANETSSSSPATVAETTDAKPAESVDAKPEELKPAEASPADAASRVVEAPAQPVVTPDPKDIAAVSDARKDQGRPSDPDKPAAVKVDVKPELAAAPAAPKRTGQIAAFVSRKDGKLYVRQNFAPLFDVPVTIAPSDRPLGTHVFTARADKDDARNFHWSVVTLPASRRAERSEDSERAARHRKIASPIEMKPAPTPDTAAEALNRVTIPDEAIARLSDALTTGGSIIVSDQGITAGETGEGTDFIMSLR